MGDNLTEYHRRRDPSATPEPFGSGTCPADGSLRFVVQRHDATALHFDLRLERDGVLASWAVPKGVPLRTGIKRLAVQTEDHPLEYLGFAGVIPPGQYGAGRMTVWDQGTFTVHLWSEREIKVTLHGQILRGEYHMVRTGQQSGRDQWLLFRSNAAGPGAEDPTPRMRELRPMLAQSADVAFDHDDWFFEIKWDGYRTLALVTGDGVMLRSRSGRDVTDDYPEMAGLRRSVLVQEVILDGELCILDDEGRAVFSRMQNHDGTAVLVVFDILYRDGTWLCDRPLEERRALLRESVSQDHPAVLMLPDQVHRDGTALFDAVASRGVEGIIAKRRGSTYRPGQRTPDWKKVKAHKEMELMVGGWTTGAGSRRTLGAILVGVPSGDGTLRFHGAVGSGFDEATLRRMATVFEADRTAESPFDGPVSAAGTIHFVRPSLWVRVRYAEITSDGRLRAPVFLGFVDKAPKAATKTRDERPAHTPGSTSATPFPEETAPNDDPDANDTQIIADGARRVRLTNRSKVYWPNDGITKGDMLRHYMAVAPWLVPHLEGRPMILKRFPNGVEAPPFFQHNAPDNTPQWMHTVHLGRGATSQEANDYLVVNDALDLLWVANLGCIDMNPWLSRANTPDLPTHVLFDIDPPDGHPYDAVVEAALLVRAALQQVGLKGYPKTSGSKGMHVSVPVETGVSYDTTRAFATAIGEHLAVTRADLLTTSMAKSGRRGRIYMDANQNARGRTVASVYSLRPRPGAPVSTPLGWDEVRPGLDPRDFTSEVVSRRLAERGDLFQGVLDEPQDLNAALASIR